MTNQPPPTCALNQRITLTDSSDLQLFVGKKEDGTFRTQFDVASVALCLASPVFKAMLLGPFKEKDSKVIELPEDDAESLELFLRVAHLRFDTLPAFSKRRVQKLAVTGDKYQCLSVLYPWRHAFRAALEHVILSASKGETDSQLVVAGTKVREDLIPEGLCGKSTLGIFRTLETHVV